MTTFTRQISNDADDGFDDGSSYFSDSGTIAGADSFSTYTGGTRFAGITIDHGTTIASATLTICSDGFNTGSITSVTARGAASDNCAAFTTTIPSALARTTASAEVFNGASAGIAYIIDITAIVQEVINRAGWASGNALALIYTATGAGSFGGIAYTANYQDVSTGTPAIITINYAGSGPSIYNETMTEEVTAAAAHAGGFVYSSTVSESVTPADGFVFLTFGSSIVEAVTAATSFAATVTFRAAISEAAAPLDDLGVRATGWQRSTPPATTWTTASPGSSIWTPLAPDPTTWS